VRPGTCGISALLHSIASLGEGHFTNELAIAAGHACRRETRAAFTAILTQFLADA
jgi:hypothetical protein